MSAGPTPEFVIVSDDASGESTVHTAVADKSGIQKLLTLSEVSSMQKELPTQPDAKKPRKKTQKSEKIPCGLCNKSFVSEKSLERHRKTVHSNEIGDSSILDPVTGQLEIGRGQSSASQQKPSIVVKDQETVTQLAIELERLKSKEVKRPRWKCLKGHSCQTCGKTFTTPSNLKRHLVVHTGTKPYQCPFCPLAFSQLEGLKRHKGRHTGENIWTCSVCGKWFVEKSRYTDHMMAHIEELPYNCKICQKGFAHRVGLQKHEKLHLGQKKHVCEICQKSFSERQRLTIHYRIHTGVFPHQCKLCGQGFNRQKFLEAHMERHDRYGILKCPKCEAIFSSKASFTRHQQNFCSTPQPPRKPKKNKPILNQVTAKPSTEPEQCQVIKKATASEILSTASQAAAVQPTTKTCTSTAGLNFASQALGGLAEHCYAANAKVSLSGLSASTIYNFTNNILDDISISDSGNEIQTIEIVQCNDNGTPISNRSETVKYFVSQHGNLTPLDSQPGNISDTVKRSDTSLDETAPQDINLTQQTVQYSVSHQKGMIPQDLNEPRLDSQARKNATYSVTHQGESSHDSNLPQLDSQVTKLHVEETAQYRVTHQHESPHDSNVPQLDSQDRKIEENDQYRETHQHDPSQDSNVSQLDSDVAKIHVEETGTHQCDSSQDNNVPQLDSDVGKIHVHEEETAQYIVTLQDEPLQDSNVPQLEAEISNTLCKTAHYSVTHEGESSQQASYVQQLVSPVSKVPKSVPYVTDPNSESDPQNHKIPQHESQITPVQETVQYIVTQQRDSILQDLTEPQVEPEVSNVSEKVHYVSYQRDTSPQDLDVSEIESSVVNLNEPYQYSATDQGEPALQDLNVPRVDSPANQSLFEPDYNAAGLRIMAPIVNEGRQTIYVPKSNSTEMSFRIPTNLVYQDNVNTTMNPVPSETVTDSHTALDLANNMENIPESLRTHMADVLETLSSLPQSSQSEEICVIFQLD